MADPRGLKSPLRLTWRSSLQALGRAVMRFREDDLGDRAAALTYFAVLSLFPGLIVLVSLLGLFGDPDGTTATLREIIRDLGPETAADTFDDPIREITSSRGQAGVAFGAGVLVALYSASGYVGAFTRASNAIYGVDEGRPFWRLRPFQLLVALAMVVLLALVLVAVVLTGPVARSVGGAIGVGDAAIDLWQFLKWPALAAIVLGIVTVLYYATPNVRMPAVRWIVPGAMLSVGTWAVASLGFGYYVANFGSYDKTYGALAGAISFLVWVWLTNIAILLGVCLNSELERSRELDAGIEGARDDLQLPPRQR